MTSRCFAEQLGVILTTPVRYSDIPLSAVDFHISSIVEELLQRPQILEAAETLCCNCKDRDAAAVLKRAMWLFRSGLNLKKVVSDSLNTKQEDEKLVLHQLWTASQACADAWSSGYLRRRFTVS